MPIDPSFLNSMDRILFSHSYFMRLDPKQWKAGLPYPPLGTLYAASLMRQNGYRVALFDTMFSVVADEITKHLTTCHPDFFVVYDDGFNYLTKMCLTNMREAAFRMIELAKEKGCTVIVCSSDASDHFDKYLDSGADFVIIGEGEQALLEVVTAIKNAEKELTSIRGIAFRAQGTTHTTPARKVLKNLDCLPFPAWDLVNMDAYERAWRAHAGFFSINMATTRGCPFRCNWCAKPIYGNRYNSRSPQNVIEEIKFLKEKFNFDHIWFCDDIFGLKPGWVHEFADLLEQEHIQLNYKIQCRSDLLLQENYIRDLARSGCTNIWMGAESGSQKILDAMDKGTSIAQIDQATRLLKKSGIKPSFFIQFGYPGETKEDIKMTIAMINRLLPDEIGISVSYPLPGTPFYKKVAVQLKEKANWTDSNELSLMFKNTFPPSFYRQLHRYVHKSYHVHLAFESLRKILSGEASPGYTTLRKVASLAYYLPASFLSRQKLHLIEMKASL